MYKLQEAANMICCSGFLTLFAAKPRYTLKYFDAPDAACLERSLAFVCASDVSRNFENKV